MRIGLVDPAGWAYSVDRPLERPFGGSQSALCYLAVELARLGHQVVIFNGNLIPSESLAAYICGILSEISGQGVSKAFDIFVVLNAATGRQLRQEARVKVPLVLWNQHAHDQQAISLLNDPDERRAWAGFAFGERLAAGELRTGLFDPERESPHHAQRGVAGLRGESQCAGSAPFHGKRAGSVLFEHAVPGLDVPLQAFPTIS